MDIGVLAKSKCDDWRFGRVPFLEKVCTVNLRKGSLIMHQIRVCVRQNGYKESVTYYRMWGAKKTIPFRFGKSGAPEIEKAYSTHYLDPQRIAALKTEKQNKQV